MGNQPRFGVWTRQGTGIHYRRGKRIDICSIAQVMGAARTRAALDDRISANGNGDVVCNLDDKAHAYLLKPVYK